MTPAANASESRTRLGDYELLRPLATGGMADVYLARHPARDREIALKVLRSGRQHEEALALFLDEARVVGSLSHPHVAAAYESGCIDGTYFLAMEYVRGQDLREILSIATKNGTPIPYACAMSIVAAAAAGLHHVHRTTDDEGRPLGVVHRDISLSNIMLSHDGTVKIIDFGIAASRISLHVTNPGVVRGKAAYMAPEQCLGDPIDQRTDVFALGVVLYELTTGVRCITGATDIDRMLAVVRGDWVPPSAVIPSFPFALERVIRTALSLDPAHRYASAAAMIEALDEVASLEGDSLGTHHIAKLLDALFAPERPRLARGTGVEYSFDATAVQPTVVDDSDLDHWFDDWLDNAPTRGRSALRRVAWPTLAI